MYYCQWGMCECATPTQCEICSIGKKYKIKHGGENTGIRRHWAICKDCQEKQCKNPIHDSFKGWEGTFPFVWEHYDRNEAIEKLKTLRCPCCGSQNWCLTDYSSI